MSIFKLHHGDALHFLETIADRSVKAIVTDPPYASGGFSEAERARGGGMLQKDSIERLGWFSGDAMGTSGLVWLLRSVAVHAARVLQDGGHLIVFCDWRMIASLQPALESAGLRHRNLIVWEKETPGMGSGFRPMHECALHLTNGTGAYCTSDTGNIIRCKRVRGLDKEHPTEKPLELMRSIIRVVAGAGDLVVDPFMGSGTTGAAAVRLGCRFAGADRDARFVAIASERLQSAHAAVAAGVSPGDRAAQPELEL